MKTLSVFAVALHPEGVDRNPLKRTKPSEIAVALHPEGVDRNADHLKADILVEVALHPEGVDRNELRVVGVYDVLGRPPPGGRG